MTEKYIAISCKPFGPNTSSIEDTKALLTNLLKTIQYGIQKLKNNQMLLLITSSLYGHNVLLLGKTLLQLTRLEREKIIILIKGGLFSMPNETETIIRTLETTDSECFMTSIEMEKEFEECKKNLFLEKNTGIKLGYILGRCHFKLKEFIEQLKFLKKLKETMQVEKIGLCEVGMEHLHYAFRVVMSIDFLELEFSPNVKYLLKEQNIHILTRDWCDSLQIHIISTNTLKQEETEKLNGLKINLQILAKEIGIQINQLILAWTISHGMIPLIESPSLEENIINMNAFEFNLSVNDRKRVDLLTYDIYEVWNIKRY